MKKISEKFYEGLRKKSQELVKEGIKGHSVKILYITTEHKYKYLTIKTFDIAEYIYREMLYQLHKPKKAK